MSSSRKLVYSSLAVFVLAVCIAASVILSRDKRSMVIDRVVVVTIDTLRADHLGCFGYMRDTSPFLDRFAAEGVLFKNAFAPMPTTVPSHASLFTSLYPIQHRVLKNGQLLADRFVTMAERFSEKGFKTAAIVSTESMFDEAAVNQGFDYYDEAKDLPERMLYRRADETVDAALAWLETVSPDDKLFLWVHVFDPHTPSRPETSHYERFLNAPDRGEFLDFLVTELHVDPIHADAKADAKRDKLLRKIASYDAEIAHLDDHLSRLYDGYRSRGLEPKSLWVVVADHGEGVGSHNWWGHGGFVYNEQLRAALMFHFPPAMRVTGVVDDVVELIDVFPTVFEIVEGDDRGLGEIQGTSLMPLLFPGKGVEYNKQYAFAQRRHFDPPGVGRDFRKKQYEPGEKYALQSSGYKYIHRTEGEDELYHLEVDPYEQVNLIGRGLEAEGRMKEALLLLVDELAAGADGEMLSVDEEAMEKLKALGYVR